MSDPVVAADGHTYERSFIEEWFRKNLSSPLTGQRLETATLFPNNAIKTVISKWNIRIPTLLEGIDAAAARFQQEGDALRASVAQQSKERASLLAEKNTKERVLAELSKKTVCSCNSKLEDALYIRINSAEAWRVRGVVFSSMSKFDEALQCFHKALECNARDIETLNALAQFLESRGEFQDALDFINRAISVLPDNPDLLNNKGVILHKLGRCNEALDIFAQVLSLSEDNPSYWRNQADCLRSLGRLKDALASYNRSLTLRPGHRATEDARSVVIHSMEK